VPLHRQGHSKIIQTADYASPSDGPASDDCPLGARAWVRDSDRPVVGPALARELACSSPGSQGVPPYPGMAR